MGLAGYQLNSQTVTIGALALGLGVDYAVHYVIRLEEEVEMHPQKTVAQWTSKTTATTGRAMLGAAISTAGGFCNSQPLWTPTASVVWSSIHRCNQPRDGVERDASANIVRPIFTP